MALQFINKKRDDAKLICDIGELTDLFHDAPSLESFLNKIVEMISSHMQSEVCSIYLYDENTQELILKATKGLKASSIGKVKMKMGEGLVGLAVKEYRPICEKEASKNPAFKYFPGIGEEPFESFLVIPILRGSYRIGAMVLQNSKKNFFQPDDIQIFRAITSQLATTIETTRMIMGLNRNSSSVDQKSWDASIKLVTGKAGSEGFAYGRTVLINDEGDWTRGLRNKISKNRYDFPQAVKATQKQLEELQQMIEEKLSDVASLIFTAQILMLKDQMFSGAIETYIKNNMDPMEAVIEVVEDYVRKLERLSDAHLRDKIQDIKDVGYRLLSNMAGEHGVLDDIKGKIVVARELLPSDILKLSSQEACGFILLSGGVSSHLSILARSLALPLIIAEEQKLLDIPKTFHVMLDAEVGNIYINPTDDVVKKFRKRDEERQVVKQVKASIKEETKTNDGKRIILQANINLLSDLKVANELRCDGVGLYRSEFPFIIRNNFPSEEEQYVVYKRLVDGMPGKEITIRTLDIGGDKVLSYYDFGKEENPFLGMRSIRFSLKHQDIFSHQIMAILRAGVKADIRIMFPMISSLDEFIQAKSIVLKCIKDLEKREIPCHVKPKIGLMIEMPSVLEMLEPLSREADFFCIGTNDFIQYMLAVDRTNEKVADMYAAHHPAVLRGLKKIVDCARKAKIDVSICGDMAHQEQYLPFLIGIGIKKFSLDSRYLPKIQSAIAGIDTKQAQKLAKEVLAENLISSTQKYF